MTVEPVRYPCPRCGESVLDIAQQCYRCRADLLVSLVITRPLADQRGVYEAAKALCDQFPNLRFAEVRDCLQGRKKVMLANTTRSVAAWIGGVLDQYKVGHTVHWHEERQVRSRTGAKLALGGLLAVAAAGAALLWWDPELLRARSATLAPVQAAPPPDAPAQVPAVKSTRELAARVVPATATVTCGSFQGSGFFVTPDRVVTNQHVLCKPQDGTPEVVLEDGRRLPATILRAEERLDAAILDVPGANVTPLPVGDAMSVQRGDKVYAVGAPLGMTFTMSEGIVSHPRRRSTSLSYIQVDLSITSGNSGGPLLNDQGEVVGLVTYKVGSDATIGLALAINHIYTGDKPIIAAPASYDAAQWESELQAAWQEDEKARKEMRELTRKPMLLRAKHDGSKFFAAVAYMGDQKPPPKLPFAVVLDQGARCDIGPVSVDRWRLVARSSYADEDLPPSVRSWLEMNEMGRNEVFIGLASFEGDKCPNRAFTSTGIVLKNGMDGFDRLEFGY